MPAGIVLFGANGAGKTTLGRALARALGFCHMDAEDYFFEPSPVPYAVPRGKDAAVALMRADMDRHGAFVLSCVTGDYGASVASHYALGIWLEAPAALRVERVKRRALDQFGARATPGGDLYERERRFVEFVEKRNTAFIDAWADTLSCPVIRLDGARPVLENISAAVAAYARATGNR